MVSCIFIKFEETDSELFRLRFISWILLLPFAGLNAQNFQVQYHVEYQDKKKTPQAPTQKISSELELYPSIKKTLSGISHRQC